MAYLDQIAADDRAAEEIQYQRELERAARGSGFIAAEVSPFGEVLQEQVDPGFQDPALIAQQLKLEAAAQRYKGQQMYASLIKNGATPAEAIRLAGQDLFANNPTGLVNAVVRSQPRPVPLQRMLKGQPTRAALAQEDNIKQEIRSLRETLSGGRYGAMAAPKGGDKKQIEDRLRALEAERVRVLDRPEFNPNVDQTGYSRIRNEMESDPIQRPAIIAQEQPVAPSTPKELTTEIAKEFLRLAAGDKNKARKLAQDAGYSL